MIIMSLLHSVSSYSVPDSLLLRSTRQAVCSWLYRLLIAIWKCYKLGCGLNTISLELSFLVVIVSRPMSDTQGWYSDILRLCLRMGSGSEDQRESAA